jgi:hypothetical protein
LNNYRSKEGYKTLLGLSTKSIPKKSLKKLLHLQIITLYLHKLMLLL